MLVEIFCIDCVGIMEVNVPMGASPKGSLLARSRSTFGSQRPGRAPEIL